MRRGIVLLLALYGVGVWAQPAAHPLFEPIADILLGPRCLNCHTAREFPTQGDDRRRHDQQIIRGASGFGAPTLQCPACHQDENTGFDKVPGAENWHLAPLSMAWETPVGDPLDPVSLCIRLKDTGGNGGRSLNDLLTHITNDHLVLWGFEPGKVRTGPTLTHDEFVTAFQAWVTAGGPCQ